MLFVGAPREAVPWFTSLSYDFAAARDGNVSDWLLDLVSVGFTKPEVGHAVLPWMDLTACRSLCGCCCCMPADCSGGPVCWCSTSCQGAPCAPLRLCVLGLALPFDDSMQQLQACPSSSLCSVVLMPAQACLLKHNQSVRSSCMHDVQGYMGRSMTDISDVQSAAKLFATLQQQKPDGPRDPPGVVSAHRGMLTALHKSSTYPARCAACCAQRRAF